MKSYTRPDGYVVVPMEGRRRFVVMTPAGAPVALVGYVTMDTDPWGLYEAMTNSDEFRSVSIAHALDEVVRQAAAV